MENEENLSRFKGYAAHNHWSLEPCKLKIPAGIFNYFSWNYISFQPELLIIPAGIIKYARVFWGLLCALRELFWAHVCWDGLQKCISHLFVQLG